MAAHQTYARTMTGSAHHCIHEYVERPFEDVVRMLRSAPALLGILRRRSRSRARDRAQRGVLSCGRVEEAEVE